MKLTTRLAMTAAVVGVAAAPGAQAATPENGTISASTPKVAWSGSLNNAWVTWNAWFLDPSAPCAHSTQCDQFDLKLATDGDLVFRAASDATYDDGSVPSVGIRIEKPDGEIVYGYGDGGTDKPLEVAVDGAEAGDYVVHVTEATAAVGTDPSIGYTANAELLGAQAPAAPAPPAPPAVDQPAPPAAAAPAAEQRADSSAVSAFTLTAKAPSVSARKAKKSKSFSVKVTTSRAIQGLTATLKKGKKTVGTGKVTAFGGNGAVKVRVPKNLKAGTYQLVLTGTDGGMNVSRTLTLKIKR
jgi:hypothetical protein